MDTFKSPKKQLDKIEQFLDSLDDSTTADDVPVEALETAATAYQKYLLGQDKGKSLEQLKTELGC